MDKSILEMAAAGVGFAQVAVNLVRMGVDLPRWAPPLLAAAFGIGLVALLVEANSLPFDAPAIAQIILAGLMAGAGAVGANELGTRAQAATAKRRGAP